MEKLRLLILVRAGRNSIHRSWSYLCHSDCDIAVSVYDDSDWSGNDTHFIHRAPGGKFQGIKSFYEMYPQTIETYDYVWFFEDDLVLTHSVLLSVLGLLSVFKFLLAAPSLSYESYFTWAIGIQNEKFLFRGTDFVEVMAPIMSREFLKKALPYFGENYSSFGYEWLWRKFLSESGDFAAILDVAPIIHTRPFRHGTLGKNRPAGGLSPGEDRQKIIEKYNLSTAPFKNKFGVTLEKHPRLLVGNDLIHEMLSGYRKMLNFNSENHFRCLDEILKSNRPILTIDDVRKLPKACEIESLLLDEKFNFFVGRSIERGPV